MVKILVVDDSPTEVHKITHLLVKNGMDVIAADSGEQAVTLAKRELPDLVLMDVVMPGMNGFQATRQICRAKETSHIPVVMISAKDQESDRMWGARQGAKAYLTKPVDEKQLLATINQVAVRAE